MSLSFTLCEGLYVFGLRAFCQNLLGGKEVNTGSWDNERGESAVRRFRMGAYRSRIFPVL